jgi:MSHA biogenesis protein MshJ
MKQRWLKFAARIDALSQRERIMSFGATAAVLVFVAQMGFIGPLLRQQALLRGQIVQQQNNIAGINEEITQKLKEAEADPDAPLRARLGETRAESARLSESLRAMQQGLVPPERVAPLLESILRANGRLKMVAVRTLPVEPVGGIGEKNASKRELLFRHGVEVTVRGGYLDMIDYMSALEALPTQLFWGKAQLEVEEYPSVRLTLTLYTLSLDEKWMKL